jgi:hypothetical protein
MINYVGSWRVFNFCSHNNFYHLSENERRKCFRLCWALMHHWSRFNGGVFTIKLKLLQLDEFCVEIILKKFLRRFKRSTYIEKNLQWDLSTKNLILFIKQFTKKIFLLIFLHFRLNYSIIKVDEISHMFYVIRVNILLKIIQPFVF